MSDADEDLMTRFGVFGAGHGSEAVTAPRKSGLTNGLTCLETDGSLRGPPWIRDPGARPVNCEGNFELSEAG